MRVWMDHQGKSFLQMLKFNKLNILCFVRLVKPFKQLSRIFLPENKVNIKNIHLHINWKLKSMNYFPYSNFFGISFVGSLFPSFFLLRDFTLTERTLIKWPCSTWKHFQNFGLIEIHYFRLSLLGRTKQSTIEKMDDSLRIKLIYKGHQKNLSHYFCNVITFKL